MVLIRAMVQDFTIEWKINTIQLGFALRTSIFYPMWNPVSFTICKPIDQKNPHCIFDGVDGGHQTGPVPPVPPCPGVDLLHCRLVTIATAHCGSGRCCCHRPGPQSRVWPWERSVVQRAWWTAWSGLVGGCAGGGWGVQTPCEPWWEDLEREWNQQNISLSKSFTHYELRLTKSTGKLEQIWCSIVVRTLELVFRGLVVRVPL